MYICNVKNIHVHVHYYIKNYESAFVTYFFLIIRIRVERVES